MAKKFGNTLHNILKTASQDTGIAEKNDIGYQLIENDLNSSVSKIKITDIFEGNNIRTTYNNIDELAQSIKNIGLIQPITVMKKGLNSYLLIAGHRRFRAFKQLGINEIDAFIKNDIDEIETAQLIENLQRDDLSPGDTEKAILIIKEIGYKSSEIATKIGKSKNWVSSILQSNKIRDAFIKSPAGGTFPIEEIYDIPTSFLSDMVSLQNNDRDALIKEILTKKLNRESIRKKIKKLTTQYIESNEITTSDSAGNNNIILAKKNNIYKSIELFLQTTTDIKTKREFCYFVFEKLFKSYSSENIAIDEFKLFSKFLQDINLNN